MFYDTTVCAKTILEKGSTWECEMKPVSRKDFECGSVLPSNFRPAAQKLDGLERDD